MNLLVLSQNSGSIFGTFISNYTYFISKYCIIGKGQRKINETLNESFGFVINSGSIFGTLISNYTDFISKYCIIGKGQRKMNETE
jgi:hypothetical protein